MKILVVGAGAVGGYFGARLMQAGRDVTFLVRPGRAEQLAAHGLRIRGVDGDTRLTPVTITAERLSSSFDIVLVAVKAYALESAIADLGPAVGPDTIVIPTLNGMRQLNLLRDRFGTAHVYGGVCLVVTSLGDDGEIVQLNGLQELSYGPLDGVGTSTLERVDQALSGAGFVTHASTTIVQDMWEKWLLLGTLGALTCLTRGNVGQIEAVAGGAELVEALLAEVVAIATAAGHRPRERALDGARAALTERGSTTASSMYRDLTQHRRTEVEHLLGDLHTRAGALGVPAPLLNATLVSKRIYEIALAQNT